MPRNIYIYKEPLLHVRVVREYLLQYKDFRAGENTFEAVKEEREKDAEMEAKEEREGNWRSERIARGRGRR